MTAIHVSLDAFEGPLDLLLHLIEKNEIDIYNIPVAELTDQYIEYIDYFSLSHMDSLSEFLVMASTLLELKSKMLLPPPVNSENEEEPDPREALVNSLLEYKRFRNVIEILKQNEENGERFQFRQPEHKLIEMLKNERTISCEELLGDLTHEELYRVFENCLKHKALVTDVVRSGFKSITKDTYTVSGQTKYLLHLLKTHKKVLFVNLFKTSSSKTEKIITFLAVLELVKSCEINIVQENLFGNIEIVLQSAEHDGRRSMNE